MPTGYTTPVQDGTVTDLKTFALQCARNFGALVSMRDDPSDAPIPERFEPSTYHTEALAKAKARVAELEAMTPEQAKAAALAADDQEAARRDKYVAEAKAQSVRYVTMMTKVREWKPPTADHEGLKRFMMEQLSESLAHDCSTEFYPAPEHKLAHNWVADELAAAYKDLAYHSKAFAEDQTRCNNRTAWVQSLRRSLEPGVPA
jgi:hypothetical protein